MVSLGLPGDTRIADPAWGPGREIGVDTRAQNGVFVQISLGESLRIACLFQDFSNRIACKAEDVERVRFRD